MSKVIRFSPVLFWSLVAITIVSGFVHWMLFVPVAFLGGFVFKREGKMQRPVIYSSLAVVTGWLLMALGRDLLEGGRISSRLASFLSLPHASFTYVVLILICFLPAFFAAASGVALGAWYGAYRSADHSSPASGK